MGIPSRGDSRPLDAAALLQYAALGSIDGVRMCLSSGIAASACRPDGVTALHYAGRRGLVPVVRLLLEHGADVNAQSITGFTPLTYAAYPGRLAVVRLLLDWGADPTPRVHGPEEDGVANDMTAADLARSFGHEEVAVLIETWGAGAGGTARRPPDQ